MRTTVVAVLLCAAASSSGQAVKTGEQVGVQGDAAQILQKMREIYASCATYLDEGRVETVFVRGEEVRNVVKNFKTAYVRPDHFYFEYSEQEVIEMAAVSAVRDDRYVIWAKSGGVSTWWTVKPEIRRWDNVKEAVSAARGVSSATSTRTSSMLIPEVKWEALLHVTSAGVVGEETLDGVKCWRIDVHTKHDEFLVWIDCERHLLMQVYEENEFNDFSTRSTTTYRPQINVEIPASQFDFVPPK